jgi:hypothetical protein
LLTSLFCIYMIPNKKKIMCVKFHNFIKRIDLHDHFEYDF